MARWLIHDKSLLKMVISQSALFEYQRAISRHLPTRSIMLFWGAPKSALFWYPSRVPNFIRHGLHKPSQIGALLLGYHSQSHRGRFPQLYKLMAFPLNIGTFASTEEISNCLASGICRWHGTQEFSVFFSGFEFSLGWSDHPSGFSSWIPNLTNGFVWKWVSL